MQPALGLCPYIIKQPLQYPQTGRTSCNPERFVDLADVVSDLQYPQTGRTSCNLAKSSWRRKKSQSCSTLRRVEPHATHHLLICNLHHRTCSTLRRVEPHATHVAAVLDEWIIELAVPSDGSNLMQQCNAWVRSLPESVLQYPQTGRTSCNPCGRRQYTELSYLA